MYPSTYHAVSSLCISINRGSSALSVAKTHPGSLRNRHSLNSARESLFLSARVGPGVWLVMGTQQGTHMP